jgi:plasmid replication initiation protein
VSEEEKTYKIKLNPEFYVVTANDLIKGKQKMTLRESQILYIAMAQVVKEDKDFKTYTTTIPELAEFMKIDESSLYRDIKGICKSLLQRVVEIKVGGDNCKTKGKNWRIIQWVSLADYTDGILTIRLHDEIKPYLIELVSHYSQSLLSTLCSFNSYYASRLYQLIVCERGEHLSPKEEWELSCDEIREFFQIGAKEYSRNYNLIQKTIVPAIEEISKTDFAYIWDYEEIHGTGRGRPLLGVRFKATTFKTKEEKDWYFNRCIPVLDDYNNSKPSEV